VAPNIRSAESFSREAQLRSSFLGDAVWAEASAQLLRAAAQRGVTIVR
jgi:hypothetical protein